MTDWRDHILKEFTPQVARLTLVADPDGLLMEEGILHGLEQRGFELIPFEDPIAFRFAYESNYRSRWDRGELTELVVVLRSEENELDMLPYDLLQAGRQLSFHLYDLFPKLSYPVVAELERSDLEVLYQAYTNYEPAGALGDNGTKDFILHHVFEIVPDLLKKDHNLLGALLRLHYQDRHVPPVFYERFIQVLQQGERFPGWPLDTIIPERSIFFQFLQERWPYYLSRLTGRGTKDASEGYRLEFDGPLDIPYDHDEVRVYIDNLFLEGMLHPVAHAGSDVITKTDEWTKVGLLTNPDQDRLDRFNGLIHTTETTVPAADSGYRDWLFFAQRWSELTALLFEDVSVFPKSDVEKYFSLRNVIDATFYEWLGTFYGPLHNQSARQPIMVHHIPRMLKRILETDRSGRIALIVLDGMSFDQWIAIKTILAGQLPDFTFEQDAVFAWIPTITSVSRQAIFSGQSPYYFPSSILRTDAEPKLWEKFWVDAGLKSTEIAFIKGIESHNVDTIKESLSNPKLRVVGIVINTIDDIIYGMELGSEGMHNQVRLWVKKEHLKALLQNLADREFVICITSDHGNVEAQGLGKPSEKSLADLRGERVRVYPDAALRKQVKEQFPETIEWPPLGLPKNFLPLMAPNRMAFTQKGKQIVSHGGISIEEVIVPFVQVQS